MEKAIKERLLHETDLAALAKQSRKKAGLYKSEAARQLGVKRGTIHLAEEYPNASLAKLRIRMIETFSSFKVSGPVYILEKK